MSDDRAVLPKKARREIALHELPRAFGIRLPAFRQMPVYGKQNVLLELPCTLLQARNARKDTSGHALFGTENDVSSPDNGNAARY